jgi:hypothetical protein
VKKKIINLTLIISVVLIILFITLIITFLYFSNHKKILEERLDVNLPQSTEIIKYSNDAIFKAGVCAAKISIADSDYDDFITQLNINYLRDDLDHKPREENIINWWDLDKKDIEMWYSDCLSPNHFIFGLSRPKTAEQDIYITYSVNGERTVYLVYVE